MRRIFTDSHKGMGTKKVDWGGERLSSRRLANLREDAEQRLPEAL